ncbi:MAG: hypothetical protein JSS06_08875 [Proteobacteria bacterium]|nr:hypothetical protein [Pseudomonadota bacterium]
MSVKTMTFFTGIMIMILFSLSAMASESHLVHAIKHAEAAAAAADGKAAAEHAEKAKTHAIDAKNDKTSKSDPKHIDDGIKCLDDAIKEGKGGNTEAAKKAAADAVNHFKQAVSAPAPASAPKQSSY